ncbi:hypothetical protein Rhopal_007413-T1 [Rhodotorula paludigena]|uniref:Uncharacterized protein n=1 Tax=Rhodotorula paludigena TaxID=86838 RepID=A0AAV5GYR6_9BASI|nr:hypothetical protein Rhopal_007413-T1 [Rhodotorula paludigena]
MSRTRLAGLAVAAALLLLVVHSLVRRDSLSEASSRPVTSTRDPTASYAICTGRTRDTRRCAFSHVCLAREPPRRDKVPGGKDAYRILYGVADDDAHNDLRQFEDFVPAFVALRTEATWRADGLKTAALEQVPWSDMPLAEAEGQVWREGTTIAYQLIADGDLNFGHGLADDVFGLWETLGEFGLDDRPEETRIAAVLNCTDFDKEDLRARCERQHADLMPLLTSHPVEALSALLPESEGDSSAVCFERLVIGTGSAGSISYASNNANRARTLRAFRDHVYRTYDLSPPSLAPAAGRPDRPPHILAVQKRGRRHFVNFTSTLDALRLDPAFAGAKWTVTDSFDALSFRAQLELLRTVDVALSPTGGLSMSFLLLPDHAALVVAGFVDSTPDAAARNRAKVRFRTGEMDAHFWAAQAHVRVEHYPLDGPEDYRLPEDVVEKNEDRRDDPWWLRNWADVVLREDKLRALLLSAVKWVQEAPL